MPIPAVHLIRSTPVRRDQNSTRVFALNEPGQPLRTASSPESLTAIIDWLNVEKSARYLPPPATTFCNIYAYDYCYLGAGYLPRVWWMDEALKQIAAGNEVVPRYEQTVTELNANSLHDWLIDYGPQYGWQRVAGVAQLQEAANAGKLAIICARRKDLGRSGHICAVVPETAAHHATRIDGTVTVPLQSQAGTNNFSYVVRTWWLSDKFAAFGFFIAG